MDKINECVKPAKDKWKIVFFIFLLHGLGTLMPWNMFITAKSYFVDFKLVSNDGNVTSVYANNFMQYMGFASQIPNLIFNWLNIFVHLGGDLTKRIVYSILFELAIFIITVILAILDSSNWQNVFFWITMISVVLLNMANGIYQNSIYGMVATLPIKYTGAVVLGSNISGLFAAIVDICSTYIFSSYRTSAIYYFITAMLILLICFDTYFALPLNRFYRYHELRRLKEEKPLCNSDVTRVPYFKIFKEAFPQLFNIFFTFFVTLAVFPAVHSDIKPYSDDFFISKERFTSITCFLTFNLFAMLGSLMTSWYQWPKANLLCIPVILRAVFLPLFLFCNYIPKSTIRSLPVIITNDWAYWLIAIIMSFSSGYLSSLGMMYAPQMVLPKYQITAGMFAAAMLITGIFSGILFSFILPSLVAI
ncbi:equilibrative nucleoside transporter 1 [Lucilia sericata]|uniref:equilibrative nucleoside transporter 1 n=1 Tax=Lucilia sericata TaxID=13632 RepID=UPI0018A8650E|nr:equilibrative nucleoside transporter 1 [Lucilia sericata]